MTFTGSSARRTPLGVSKDGEERRSQPPSSNPEQPAFVWISCRHPVAAEDLERILQKEAWVHSGQEAPKEGVPSSVVLCANDTEDLSESVERVRKLYPDTPVLVFGPHADLPLAQAALQTGARGYIHAEMEPDQLVRAFKVASEGEVVAPRKLLEHLVIGVTQEERAALDALSSRQREILELVADSLSNAQIARRLYLSESTIKQHLRAAYKLLGVRNRAQAARIFRRGTQAAGRLGT